MSSRKLFSKLILIFFSSHYHTDAFISVERTFSVDLASVVSQLERNTLEVYLTVTDADGNTGNALPQIPFHIPRPRPHPCQTLRNDQHTPHHLIHRNAQTR
jgi:hypothetical protein